MKIDSHSDEVKGEVFGPISIKYSACLKLVEEWPKHKVQKGYPARQHAFWSELEFRREAIMEYVQKSRCETKLGDGSPCITYLVRVCDTCGGEHPMGCCAQDGKD